MTEPRRTTLIPPRPLRRVVTGRTATIAGTTTVREGEMRAEVARSHDEPEPNDEGQT